MDMRTANNIKNEIFRGSIMKELSLNILDIAQNSVKAGAKNISIRIAEDKADDTLTISITDDGCGMDEETLRKVTDPFYTTRTTRKVGLGIPFFNLEAKQTGGDFKITSQVGKGTKVTASFKPSSVDMTPLGDIISTILTLIQGSPDIDFLFRHTAARLDVELDTKQLREVLGDDVALSSPEVLEWIKNYLNEAYGN